jgi:hypothetical protein
MAVVGVQNIADDGVIGATVATVSAADGGPASSDYGFSRLTAHYPKITEGKDFFDTGVMV